MIYLPSLHPYRRQPSTGVKRPTHSYGRALGGSRSSGQSMVEFALGLPILLVLIFGVIEFGRMLFIYTATTTASREAARYAAVAGVNSSGTLRYKDCAGIRDAARRIGSLAGIQDADITIDYDTGPTPGTPYATCETMSGTASSGHRVRVQVVAHYLPIVPLVNLPGFDITSFTARTIIMNVVIDP